MFKKGILLIIFLASVMVLFMSSHTYAEKARGVTEDMIKLGMIADMTGPTATDAIPIATAFRNYFRHINNLGGINGRRVEIIVEDGRYSIPLNLAAFKKLLYRDKVLALYGMTNTGASIALLPQYEKEKVPIISITVTERLVTPFNRYAFIVCPSYRDYVDAVFNYILEHFKLSASKKIVFVTWDSEYGKVGFGRAKEIAKKHNIKLTKEIIPLGVLDAITQTLSIKRFNPDVVVLHHTVGGNVALLRDAKKFGISYPFIGTIHSCNDDTIKIARKAAEGFVGVHAFSSWYDDTPGMAKLREITLKYETGTEKQDRIKGYSHGWANAMVWAEGMRRAGRDLNGETMVNGLETIRDFNTGGVCGPITITPRDHKGGKYVRFYKANVDNLRLVPITEWTKAVK